jgi:cytochrome c oxidase subunit 2
MRWLPPNVSTYGSDIDGILHVIWYLTVAWFFLTIGLLLFFMIRFRRGPGRARYIRGDRLREAAWILVPCVIVLGIDLWLDAAGAPVWARVKEMLPETRIQVRVTGVQFNWEILYPGPDGAFGTEDDRQIDNELHVPVSHPVLVQLQSKDVIHSFFLPHLRLKQDVIPGRTINAWFEATTPGQYELVCAELCGFGHSGMKGILHVHTPEEYRTWLEEQWPAPVPGA